MIHTLLDVAMLKTANSPLAVGYVESSFHLLQNGEITTPEGFWATAVGAAELRSFPSTITANLWWEIEGTTHTWEPTYTTQGRGYIANSANLTRNASFRAAYTGTAYINIGTPPAIPTTGQKTIQFSILRQTLTDGTLYMAGASDENLRAPTPETLYLRFDLYTVQAGKRMNTSTGQSFAIPQYVYANTHFSMNFRVGIPIDGSAPYFEQAANAPMTAWVRNS